MKLLRYIFLFSSVSILVTTALKGQMPNCQLYLFDYSIEGDSIYFNNPRLLSDFNPDGYNNQPSFISDKDIYVSTNYYNAEKPDIIRLNLDEKTLVRVTNTEESEYSPTIMPDGKHFSVVRVEKDGKDQSLWRYPLNQSNSGARLIKNLDNIGYHTWLSENKASLFLVDEPVKMVITDIETGQTRYLLDNIGRCMKRNSDGKLIIVHKLFDEKWYLKIYDPEKGTFKIVTETMPGQEDFEILEDGSILMAQNGEIWRYANKSLTDAWKKIDDFSDLQINKVTRISARNNKIVFVVNKN